MDPSIPKKTPDAKPKTSTAHYSLSNRSRSTSQPPRPIFSIQKPSMDGCISESFKNTSSSLDRYLNSLLNELVNQVKTRLAPERLEHSQIQNHLESCLINCQTIVKTALTEELTTLQRTIIQRNTYPKSSGIQKVNDNATSVSTKHEKRQRLDASLPRMLRPLVSEQKPNDSIIFGLTSSNDRHTHSLFQRLSFLPPMDKNGSMSGHCDRETTQMENFLKESFGFKNLRDQYIVQGVKAFKLKEPIETLPPNRIVRFPNNNTAGAKSFAMSIEEILRWQSSYKVYADKDEPGMSKDFLLRALQGQSSSGSEAFLMKFVVRISDCPILMEFDGQIIPREPHQKWPHNIKLVSVTGIDFAGRIHDVDDIRTYVTNWQEVYEIVPQTGLPCVYNGRDFRRRLNGPRGKLNKELLLKDLKRMARLRLRACDAERVQIVVETGIGLGVFAGKSIGIDETVRIFSARAIREVLQEDGNHYQSIRAVVFALPIFDEDIRNERREDTFYAFKTVFQESKYQGPIPVLIIDQDMHRLTVAIAKEGFRVSELNPADSHGVFGEYWQNRGPAVEEKLALTTVGLLVQHHLINRRSRDTNNYHLI